MFSPKVLEIYELPNSGVNTLITVLYFNRYNSSVGVSGIIDGRWQPNPALNWNVIISS